MDLDDVRPHGRPHTNHDIPENQHYPQDSQERRNHPCTKKEGSDDTNRELVQTENDIEDFPWDVDVNAREKGICWCCFSKLVSKRTGEGRECVECGASQIVYE